MKNKIVIIILLLIPLYTCESVDNPLNLLLTNSGKSIYLKNEAVSNVKSVSIDSSKITIKIKEEKLLLGVVTLKDGLNDYSNQNIEWISQNNSIATVDNNGKITGISEGEVIITAKYKNQDKYTKIIIKVLEDQVNIVNPVTLQSKIPNPSISNTTISTPIPTVIPKPTSTPRPEPTSNPTRSAITPALSPNIEVTATPSAIISASSPNLEVTATPSVIISTSSPNPEVTATPSAIISTSSTNPELTATPLAIISTSSPNPELTDILSSNN